MKNILRASLAAAALIASAGAAQAQTTLITEGTGLGGLLGSGTFYTALSGSLQSANSNTATPNLETSFTLSGTVAKDCSFYAGNSAASTNINLGQLGVVTNNGANVGDAFEMRAAAGANITSGTAGCNFNNTVTIGKDNGINGMEVVVPSGFDSNQFQANLPYSITANWVGTTNTVGGAPGGSQSLTVGTNEDEDDWTGGAWRSAFNMLITVPAPNKGLVAGTYEDTITVTLAAM